MDKVYAVYEYVPYEYSDILKVFRTKEAAHDHASQLKPPPTGYIDIAEWEVND